jgi:quercetin dioxygenase-like cupin family protein
MQRCARLWVLLVPLLCCGVAQAGPYQRVETLLSTEQTVIGEPLAYPPGRAKVTASIVTIQPGEETAFHRHGVPLFAYVLSGVATVDYGDKGVKVYPAGTAFMEAMGQRHRGMNRGPVPVRILAVYMGSDQAESVIVK